jgi:NAD(P)-dependent dehydrogenase (short-subunit alcohol dehydrogenase family)
MILQGKTSLVTGASRGIGAATAVKLAELGSNIILNYRSKGSRALEVVAQIEAWEFRCFRCRPISRIPPRSRLCSRKFEHWIF